MGMWDEYCTVCGGPPTLIFDYMDAEEGESLTPSPLPNPEDYTWLESFIGISNKEELIPLASYDSYGNFDISPDKSPYIYFYIGNREGDYSTEITARGYACHVACFNLLQQELNYTLKYADLLPLLVDNECDLNKFSWSDYGGLAEYHGQFFNALQLLKDGKLWMIEEPSHDGQNKERILQLWRPLVESGFMRLDARVEDGNLPPEITELNMDKSRQDVKSSIRRLTTGPRPNPAAGRPTPNGARAGTTCPLPITPRRRRSRFVQRRKSQMGHRAIPGAGDVSNRTLCKVKQPIVVR